MDVQRFFLPSAFFCADVRNESQLDFTSFGDHTQRKRTNSVEHNNASEQKKSSHANVLCVFSKMEVKIVVDCQNDHPQGTERQAARRNELTNPPPPPTTKLIDKT